MDLRDRGLTGRVVSTWGEALKHRSSTAPIPAGAPAGWRFAFTSVAIATGCLLATPAAALGLGRLSVQSALGETLRAEIEVTSLNAEEAASLRLRVASPDAYRAAGVEYNAALTGAQVQMVRRPDGTNMLRVTSDRAVVEPFVDVIIEASWASGRLVREYTLLFDPPSTRAAQAPAPAAAPVISAAPVAPPAAAPAAPRAPDTTRRAAAPAAAAPAAPAAAMPPAPAAAPAPAPAAALPRPAGEGIDQYRVRSGDSLSRIAGRVQRPGVSLDQMLVSLFRGNPQAFMGENMNRLRAGSVLTVPSAEEAGRVTPQQAREVIVAQSADFAAYRQRLASGLPADAEPAAGRQATGRVQAQVEDRTQAATPSPDRLTLSQGAVRPGAGDAAASKDAAKTDSSTRLAELSRNVEELKKLQGATAPAGTPSAALSPAPAAPAPTPAAPISMPAAPASTPAVTTPSAPPAPAVPAALQAPKPAPAVVATPPAVAPPPATTEPGWLDSILENPLLLPGAGVLVALLAGLGLYRLRSRTRKPSGETSFLESRLQPDSFFGASGGQRIDTREAPSSQGSSTSSSSMSYSLSQIDAIGDVDPVAEADVYLAYGRDLQAEEILKEAMRANPERMAIRTKLLEVYAKRRDTKGFELLATQVHSLTRGEGEDWAKAQELGRSIDPENALYRPGGQPEAVIGSSGQPVELLGASTVTYTAPVTQPSFQPAPDATLAGGLDLDLDLVAGPTLPKGPPTDATQPLSTSASISASKGLDLDLENPTIPAARSRSLHAAPEGVIEAPAEAPAPAAAAPAASTEPGSLDFDLSDLGGLDATRRPPMPAAPAGRAADFGEFSIGGERLTPPSAGGDPLERKLELAEEFRQIGDLEGARDLLEEVVAKASGSLKTKAQAMLDNLV
jgi:pilus assembly protein FimV